MVVLRVLLLLQLSTVSAFPALPFVSQSFQELITPLFPILSSNHLFDHPNKKVLDVACWSGDYYINATIGTPPQKFKLSILFGMPYTTWVPSMRCVEPICKKRQRYDSSASKSYVPIDGYPQGVTGFLSNDTICLEGICIENYTFGEAKRTDPLIKAISADKNIDRVVSLWPARSPLYSGDFCGKLVLGDIDSQLYTGPITWVNPIYEDMERKHMFSFNIESVTIDGAPLNNRPYECAIQTLYWYIAGPPEDVSKIHATIGAVENEKTKLFTVPCEKVASLPPIVFTINGTPFVFNSTDYIVQFNNKCYSVFYGSLYVDGGWSLGTAFFSRLYTIFDAQRRQIGFANPRR